MFQTFRNFNPDASQHNAVVSPQDVLWVRCHENCAAGPDQTWLNPGWPLATDPSLEMQVHVCVSIDHRLEMALTKQTYH